MYQLARPSSPMMVTTSALIAVPSVSASERDTALLHQHLCHCMAACTRSHQARGALEATHAFLSPRFVSTLLGLVALLALLTWVAA